MHIYSQVTLLSLNCIIALLLFKKILDRNQKTLVVKYIYKKSVCIITTFSIITLTIVKHFYCFMCCYIIF